VNDPAAITVRLEMGCTAAEFHHRLPLVTAVTRDAAGRQFDHVEEGRRWRLRLSEPRERLIGSLRLPVVDVEFTFEGYAPAEIETFMALFHAHFRRGGG
jgi:hypothetical protein